MIWIVQNVIFQSYTYRGTDVTQEMIIKDTIRKDLTNLLSSHLKGKLLLPGAIGDWNMKDLFTYCSEYKTLIECNNGSMCEWNEKNRECKVLVNPEWYWKYISRIVDDLLVNVNKKKEIMEEYRKDLELPEDEKVFYSKDEIDEYLEKYDSNLENKKYLYHPFEHFSYSNPNKQSSNFISQIKAIETKYTIPKHISNYFLPSSNPKDISLRPINDLNNDYFFNNINYLVDKIPRKSKKSIRLELANRIREEVSGSVLLERYRGLAVIPNADLYKKFLAIKSIEALADYINEKSWGNIIDLELLADVYSKYKLRFIVLEDTRTPITQNLFTHLPNHLKEMTNQNKKEFIYGVFLLHDNLFELVLKKNNPIFKADEIPFLHNWYNSQKLFETTLPN